MTSPNEPSSPGFPPIPKGNLTAKGIDVTNTTYSLSYERTHVPDLPFPHPKWHVRPSTGDIYETTSPILEEYDPVTGYVDSVGPTLESVEGTKGMEGWTGRVEWPESSERSSIAREAKRDREERKGDGEGEIGVRRSKRLKDRH